MKRSVSLLISLLLLLMLIVPAGVSAQDDEMEVTLFVTEDSSYSVALLDGWAAQGNREDGLSVANSEDALKKFDTDEDPAAGEFALGVLAAPAELVSQLGLDEDASEVEIFEAFLPFITDDTDEPMEIGEIEEADLAGRPAATVVVSSDTFEAIYVLYQLAPQTIGIGLIGGAPGALDEMGELGLQILATVRYSPELSETFEGDAITFNYPAEWLAEGESGIYTLTNDEAALDAEALVEGQFGIIVFDLDLLGYTGDTVSVATEVAGLIEEEGQAYSDAIEVEVGDTSVAVIDMTTPDSDGNEGGIMVVQRGDDLFGVVFLNAHAEGYQVGLIALNVLLSAE